MWLKILALTISTLIAIMYLQFSINESEENVGMENNVNDKGGFLWGLLGCCVPIVGLILFLVWKDQKPKTAKAAGIGALVSVIVGVVYYVVVFVILGAAGIAGGLY